MAETRIELHGGQCSCKGGAWALLESTQRSPCAGDSDEQEKLVLSLAEWRQIGKPGSLEAFKEAQERSEGGERRAFPRYEVAMLVRLARIPTWRDPAEQVEETVAEVIAIGGALVRSRMALDKGEMIRFAVKDKYETRAEIMYVAHGAGAGMDGIQRLGLKFLDAPLPESLIPTDAKLLP
jgi:hypothetical protein